VNDVPHLDLKRQHRTLREEILDVVAAVIDGTEFVGGPRVATFERDLAQACGVPHCIGVANGTDALKLSLRALGVGPGDEVIVPAFTFIATSGAVLDCGATPVLCDVLEGTALISPEEAARHVTPRTKAAILVHLYGLAGDPEPLRAALSMARTASPSVALLEDCAQSHGALVRGKPAGSLGDIAAFSFYPTKNLGAMGDGGAVTTGRQDLADAVRMIADHGRPVDPKRRGEHVIPGLNSRLDGLQAAVLSIKLRHLPAWNARRNEIARVYDAALASRDDVKLQRIPPGATHAYHLYALRHRKRDALMGALLRAGIQARATYPQALHEYPALAFLGHHPGDFRAAESWGREVLVLPMFPELTDEEVERVASALPAALDEAARA